MDGEDGDERPQNVSDSQYSLEGNPFFGPNPRKRPDSGEPRQGKGGQIEGVALGKDGRKDHGRQNGYRRQKRENFARFELKEFPKFGERQESGGRKKDR